MKPAYIIGIAIVIGSAISMAWWWNSPPRFPKSHGINSSTIKPMRAPSPDVPSLTSLPLDGATLVPGLEEFQECFSPTLTADLRQIVFSMNRGAPTGFDLHLATRTNSSEPFEEPVCLELTSSPETEAYPTLSPDGLVLLFVRSDVKPEIWITNRADIKSEFTSPVRWDVCLTGDSKSRVGTPQFVSGNRVVFSRSDPETGAAMAWSCQRLSNGEFSKPSPFASLARNSVVCFNPEGNRAYYGGGEGALFMLWRRDLKSPFLEPDTLLDIKSTGPFDGTTWVAPKEDVIFYCSPGPGKTIGSSRQLWMIDF